MKSSKPKKGAADTSQGQSSTNRRSFLTRLWAALGLLAMVELIAVGVVFLRRKKAGHAAPINGATVNCGSVDRYRPGTVTAFVRGRFYLARLEDGGFLAISRQCTHLGCTVPWVEKEQRFACPCHASAFDITGHVINAPAPRALDIFALRIENGIIEVDTSRSLRRDGFDAQQVTHPKRT
jgi:cytochrome b6-f complex iron-sulfur subunit